MSRTVICGGRHVIMCSTVSCQGNAWLIIWTLRGYDSLPRSGGSSSRVRLICILIRGSGFLRIALQTSNYWNMSHKFILVWQTPYDVDTGIMLFRSFSWYRRMYLRIKVWETIKECVGGKHQFPEIFYKVRNRKSTGKQRALWLTLCGAQSFGALTWGLK